MKKFFVFDIDGTLLDENKHLPASTKESIRKLKELGHEIAIATGRNYTSALPIIKELELDTYIVCNGGAGFIDHEKVYETLLPKEAVGELIQKASEHGASLVINTIDDHRRQFKEFSGAAKKVFQGFLHLQPEWDEEFWKHNDVIQCNLFCDPQDIPKFEIDAFRLVSWHEYGMDVIHKDMSKAKTILQIAKDKGIDQEHVVFFGDGHNDIEALALAGLGIAMGNASQQVKEHANYITAHVNEDGIFKALKHFNLI
ncbi:MAG: HAD family hydrolase [Turicibacter sp.]|nr:HAD family hydrolase [Turicibacter sp.]